MYYKKILSFLIIISCYIISCNAEPSLENMKKEIRIISCVLFVSLLISFIIMWLNKNRKNLLKVHSREMYDLTNSSMQTETSTGRLESITSSCRSSFSFRNSFNSFTLNNMIRPANNTQVSQSRHTTSTTAENVLIEVDGQNRRSFASVITIPLPLTSTRRNNQNRNHYRSEPIYPELYPTDSNQDVLEMEPPPIYKP
ncbi:hypothetical protein C1646_701574 [Rhizophagus diaphanus]|nr:hypothetical protein C1646_701574 [Rhizophagus diaphanus] [Rhizophagus sp. MUCL 43196]